MKRSAFFEKTILLTLSNIATGTLAFIFSIMLSRKIGARGVGLYQLVMPLYMFFLYLTGGGITITLSKIAAEKKALGKLKELYKTVRVLCLFELLWSTIITLIVIIFAKFLSSNILSDARTLYGILAFCPALIVVSISSVIKGVFYGLQRVMEPALIDIIEKAFRIGVLYFVVSITSKFGMEFSAGGAIFSMTCAELLSLILLYSFYKRYSLKNPGYGKCDNGFQLIFNVLKLSIPLGLNGILSTLFGTIITVLIPQRLQAAGIPYETSLSLLGKLQGMALNIAFYPAIIIGSLNILLIPSISEAVTFKKNHIINHRINIALKIASITAFSSAVLMFAIPLRLGEFFFKDPAVGELLRVLAPFLPIVYIESVSFALLNGLGKQKSLLINSTILSIFDLIILYIFLAIPSVNVKGYAVDFALSGMLGLILNFTVIKRNFDYKLKAFENIILPFLISIFMYILIKALLINLKSTPVIILSAYCIFLALYILMDKLSGSSKKIQLYNDIKHN